MPFQKGNKLGELRGKNKKTIEKETALHQLQQEILKEIKPLLRAALNTATGLTVMYQRKKDKNRKSGVWERTGKLIRVTDQNRVEELLKGDCTGENYYYVTTKDPNVKALEDLFNRVFGRPKESIEHSGEIKGNTIIFSDFKNGNEEKE